MRRGRCRSHIGAVTLVRDGHIASVSHTMNTPSLYKAPSLLSPILRIFFSSSQFLSYTNPVQKFWHCLANSCYLAERPVIMSKCLLLLINSCNYRGES